MCQYFLNTGKKGSFNGKKQGCFKWVNSWALL